MKLYEMTLAELQALLAKGEVTAREVTEAFVRRAEEVEGAIHALVTFTPELALAQAEEIDRRRRSGEPLSPLAGLPAVIKDNIVTQGIRTTCSSRILENFVPPYDATVVEKLKKAGLVILGKANLDEFAMGSSVENSAFFKTLNPWDLSRVPGGSSGGSAAAMAAGEAAYTLGSDTGGSVRQPAAFCGVVGMKPTYGRVSRYGLVAFASSLDQIGPITRDVRDNALVLGAIAGHDPRDSTAAPLEVPDYTAFLDGDIRGLRIGLPREYLAAGIEAPVRQAVDEAIRLLSDLGAEVEECSLPHTEYALSAYYIIAPAEASSNLARYDGVRYGLRVAGDDLISTYGQTRRQGFGAEVKRRIMLGTYALSSGYYDAYYLKAQKVRTLIRQDFDRALARYDVLLTPTAPTTAFKVGEKVDDPLTMYMSDVCTVPINLAGVPALSIPGGFYQGLPIGIQFIGRPFAEGLLYRVAYAFEQSTAFHKKRPPL